MLKIICERLIQYIQSNKMVLKKAVHMDHKICNQKIDLDYMINIIKELENIAEDGKNNKRETLAVIYEGEIKNTLEIAIKQTSIDNNIVFFVNDDFLATNTIIVDILNRILKENKQSNFIKLYNKVKLEDIIFKSKEFDKIICINDEFKYEYIKNKSKIPVEYYESY